ncbi:MAG: hypothetical protein RLZZ241_585 [Bacteroidota bacterium]|jgi:hypothetical protein
MRKVLTCLLFILYTTAWSQQSPFAQTGILVVGPMVGLNSSLDGKTGLDFGISTEYLLGGSFSLVNGVHFSDRGFLPDAVHMRQTSWQIPIALQYYTDWGTDCVEIFGITLLAGVQINLGRHLEYVSSNIKSLPETSGQYLEGLIGLGYRTGKLQFFINYTSALQHADFNALGFKNAAYCLGLNYYFKGITKP